MTYIAALFAYFFIYEIIYSMPVVVVLALLPRRAPSSASGILAFLIVGAVILASWRARLAAKSYGERDMGFWEAHQAAGIELRIQLSFLPVLGWLFKPKERK